MELARREFERSKRYQVPLSIIMLDIDHFKNINDTFGHLVGDQVLQTAAFICQKNLRSIDFIGRFGGEEFIILLPETALLDSPKNTQKTDSAETLPAQTVAERIRQTMEMQTFEIGENSIKITVSMGVAELKQADKSIDNVINYADQALLQAKNQGRNRISIWNPEDNLAQD
jgi:diguanylate cyclase (GGDEF)-like protein